MNKGLHSGLTHSDSQVMVPQVSKRQRHLVYISDTRSKIQTAIMMSNSRHMQRHHTPFRHPSRDVVNKDTNSANQPLGTQDVHSTVDTAPSTNPSYGNQYTGLLRKTKFINLDKNKTFNHRSLQPKPHKKNKHS